MSKKYRNVKDYRTAIEPQLQNWISQNKYQLVCAVLEDAFWYLSYVTEDMSSKVREHTQSKDKLNILIIELQDLLRGLLSAYDIVSLAPIALILRTTFEIKCTLTWLVKHTDPEKHIDMFFRFQEIEKLKALRTAVYTQRLSESEEASILIKNPEWQDKNTKRLVDRPHWSGTQGMSLESIARSIGLDEEYATIYRVNSKFTHGSPLLQNLYRNQHGFGALPAKRQSADFALLAVQHMIQTLQIFCEFFGIALPQQELEDWKLKWIAAQEEIAAKP